jgi:tRNA pseudouridine55 synthase
MAQTTDGILLIDKGEGETSYSVVKKVKRLFKVKKAGHAGTLDPFATGLLIALLGQGTKLSPFLMSERKVYRAVMLLGVETDTLDPTGRVIRRSAVPDLGLEEIEESAKDFEGEIQQTPPLFSAVKYQGERAYRLAREGKEIHLEKRTVTIHSLRILSVHLPLVAMEIVCSKGTYIRSLAADLGKTLGPGGHLKTLRRTASGPFQAENALCSADLSTVRREPAWRDRVIPLREALPFMREIEVDGPLARKVKQGYRPRWDELDGGLHGKDFKEGHVTLVRGDELVAIADVQTSGEGSGHGIEIKRVFS